MANLIRSAKSGSNWTINELDSYNIRLERQEALEFFGVPVLPDPAVDPELLQHLEADQMQQDRNAELVNLLDLAMLHSSGESAVDDFAVELLKLTGYVRRNRVARTHKDLPLFICGEWRHTKADVCILDCQQGDILLLVQEDKRLDDTEPLDARAPLVAEALAAFTENNMTRMGSDLPVLESKVINVILLTVLVVLIRFAGHPRNCHGGHCPNVLQDFRHPRTCDPCSTWDIPANPHYCQLLLSPGTTPSSPQQRRDEAFG